MELIFLGTGTSHGIPMIGCHCPTCSSKDPRDARTNASILIKHHEKNILIDCGRDFRIQAIREGIARVDHLFLTHTHFDHIAGIDDLRVFNRKGQNPIPVYGKEEHLEYIRKYIYHYLFDRAIQRGGGIAEVTLIPIRKPLGVEGILFEPLPVFHGKMGIYGYRFGAFAYISDVSSIPKPTLDRLQGLECLIIDALRFRPHSTHFNIEQALDVVRSVKPRQTYLTHICHDIRHREVERGFGEPASGISSALPVNLAYDGLALRYPDEVLTGSG